MDQQPAKEEAAHVESGKNATSDSPKGTPISFKHKLRRNCARFWWLYALIVIVVVLVVVLPVVYVAYPKQARSTINDAQLEVTSMSIENPTPDSYNLQLNNLFLSNSSLHANLDAFDADLHLNDSSDAFAQIHIPALEGANGTEVSINQSVRITDVDAFNDYARTVLLSKDYTIHLTGRGGLKYGGLPKTTVNYDKRIAMKGLNGLQGFNVTEFALITTATADGSNANGTVYIPNPTVSTFEMGNLTMGMSVNGTSVGVSTLRDVVLVPGANTFPLRATVNQTAVVSLLFTDYKSGIFPVDIVANSSVYHERHLSYYEKALAANQLTVYLDVIKVLEDAGLAQYLGIGNSTSNSTQSA